MALSEQPATLARRLATDDRPSRVGSSLERRDKSVTFDAVGERLFETIVREESRRLFESSQGVDVELFRSALGNLVGAFLAR